MPHILYMLKQQSPKAKGGGKSNCHLLEIHFISLPQIKYLLYIAFLGKRTIWLYIAVDFLRTNTNFFSQIIYLNNKAHEEKRKLKQEKLVLTAESVQSAIKEENWYMENARKNKRLY